MQAASTVFATAELEAMPDDGTRYELIGGAIVMTAAPGTIHQRVLFRLGKALERADPAGHELFIAPTDLDLPGGHRVEPDLVLAPYASVGDQRLTTPVLLAVEIVSPGSRTIDLILKRAVYAEAGIPAYWIVDLEHDRIECLRLVGDSYEVYATGAQVTVDWPVTASLDIFELAAPPAGG